MANASQDSPLRAIPAGNAAARPRSAAWDWLSGRRLPLGFPLLVLVSVTLVAAGQFVEDLGDSPPLQMLSPQVSIPRWTIVAVVLYMLLMLKLLQRTVQMTVPCLQHATRLEESAFRRYVARMQRPTLALDVGLLLASAAIVVLLFPILRSPLPTTNDPVTGHPLQLPSDAASAFFVLVGYTLVGWCGLDLVYTTIRLARALGQIANEPLAVNVFDTTDLLPFGHIALVVSLAPAGVIAIFLFGLGQPNGPLSSAVLILATLAGVLSLVLPLRGVHRQMSRAKEHALAEMNQQLAAIYHELPAADGGDSASATLASTRTGTLVNLRKIVTEMPTWPFHDTAAFGRAFLVASAPLIYTVLSELIKVFFISPLTR